MYDGICFYTNNEYFNTRNMYRGITGPLLPLFSGQLDNWCVKECGCFCNMINNSNKTCISKKRKKISDFGMQIMKRAGTVVLNSSCQKLSSKSIKKKFGVYNYWYSSIPRGFENKRTRASKETQARNVKRVKTHNDKVSQMQLPFS